MIEEELGQKFFKALSLCNQLVNFESKPSTYPGEAIELFCDLAKFPNLLIELLNQNPLAVKSAEDAIESYAQSIDNWKISGYPLGVKDHCNILHFFLNLPNLDRDKVFFRGKDLTPGLICEFLQDWKGIDLSLFLSQFSQLVATD